MAELPTILRGRCTVCDRRSVFVTRSPSQRKSRNSLRCVRCGSLARNRHVAQAVVAALEKHGVGALGDLRDRTDLRVLNTMSGSVIAARLEGLDHVDHTDFWDDVAPGEERDGVRCEDLTALTYPDTSLDLVITEDVLEHIPCSERAFAEIRRVLKPGGFHVFSIPFRPGRPTEVLFDVVDGEPMLREPVRYHDDPIRGRIPVFYEYGYTLLPQLDALGFHTRVFMSRHPDRRAHGIVDCTTFVSRRRQIPRVRDADPA